MTQKNWIIYGAYGYSGRLIAQHAKSLGMQPILAGRNEQETKAFAKELNLPYAVFNLSDQEKADITLKWYRKIIDRSDIIERTFLNQWS